MTPNLGVLEILNQTPMDLHTEILNGCLLSSKDDWSLIIWNLALWLGVDSYQVKVFPNGLQELIEVPS